MEVGEDENGRWTFGGVESKRVRGLIATLSDQMINDYAIYYKFTLLCG